MPAGVRPRLTTGFAETYCGSSQETNGKCRTGANTARRERHQRDRHPDSRPQATRGDISRSGRIVSRLRLPPRLHGLSGHLPAILKAPRPARQPAETVTGRWARRAGDAYRTSRRHVSFQLPCRLRSYGCEQSFADVPGGDGSEPRLLRPSADTRPVTPPLLSSVRPAHGLVTLRRRMVSPGRGRPGPHAC